MNTREIGIVKCVSCDKEMLRGELCCNNRHIIETGQKKTVVITEEFLDYFERLSV